MVIVNTPVFIPFIAYDIIFTSIVVLMNVFLVPIVVTLIVDAVEAFQIFQIANTIIAVTSREM